MSGDPRVSIDDLERKHRRIAWISFTILVAFELAILGFFTLIGMSLWDQRWTIVFYIANAAFQIWLMFFLRRRRATSRAVFEKMLQRYESAPMN